MVLMNVAQDDTMIVPGFEHQTFTCSECQDVERRLVFTKQDRESVTKHTLDQAATPVVPTSTTPEGHVAASGLLSGPVEPAQTVPVEPTQTASVEPAKAAPVETTQTVPVQLSIQNRQALRLQTNAWTKAVDKVHTHEKQTAERQAADEAERRAQFNHFWDNLTSVRAPSTSSDASSHVKADEPVRSPTDPTASPAQARDEPSGLPATPERPRRRWSWRELMR
jgi:hypothetical protein